MYSLKKSNITVHPCHEKVMCSDPAARAQPATFRRETRESRRSDLLGSRRPKAPSRIAEHGFALVQPVLHSGGGGQPEAAEEQAAPSTD